MNSKISVIVPVYNGEKTIRETLISIIKQSFSDIEIIIIDDGSTDSTLEVVKSITDPRIKIFSYSNAGLATSRNRGITLANGQYISFIDADDIWTPCKLESQMQALKEHPSCAVAYSWTDYINTDGKFLKSGRHPTAIGDVYHKLLLGNFLENGSNPLIRINALKAVGGFDESLLAAEDWDMWLRLSAFYEFVCVEKAQILYRVSANSMSTDLKRQETASLKVIERAFAHPKAKSFQHLKKYSLAQLYQYLTFKATEGSPNKQRWIAATFLYHCIKYDPSVLKQKRVILIAVLKIAFPWLYHKFRQIIRG